MKNHYQVLGINRNCTIEEIRITFKKLAQKFHPDKNNGDKFFENRFIEIRQSYEVLIDPKQKIVYDAEYDLFFNSHSNSKLKSELFKDNSNEYQKCKETEDRKQKEVLEKQRIINFKKSEKLSFEDKSWIFIANWLFIPGIVGLWMYIKYRKEGYTSKSSSVCTLTLVSIIICFILAMFFALTK